MTASSSEPRGTRLSRRLGWCFRALVMLSIAVVLQRHRMPLPAAVVAALGLASIAGAVPSRLDIGWDRSDGPWRVGDRQPLSLRVENLTRRASAPVVLELSSRGIQPVLVPVPALAPGELTVVLVDLVLVARRAECPLAVGTAVHNRLLGPPRTSPSQGSVLPSVRPRPDLPPPHLLQQAIVTADEGWATGRRGTTDPLLVRAFVPGDPLSSVHWRSTARAGSPVVVEREQLGAGRLVLLVAATPDQAVAVPTPDDLFFELLVARAAGVVQVAHATGVPVHVVAAAGPAVLPTVPSHDQVQDWLAGLGRTGPADPSLVEDAVRRAAGGVVAVLSPQPWLSGEVRRLAPTTTVLDLADAW